MDSSAEFLSNGNLALSENETESMTYDVADYQLSTFAGLGFLSVSVGMMLGYGVAMIVSILKKA